LLGKALNYPAAMIPRLQICWGCRSRCRTGLRAAHCWNATPWHGSLTWGVWLAGNHCKNPFHSVWSRNVLQHVTESVGAALPAKGVACETTVECDVNWRLLVA